MAKIGLLAAVDQRPRPTVPHPGHRIWPYLLRELAIDRPDQVGCADIPCIPLRRGFLGLVAVMDRAGRKVPARRPSNTPDAEFCIDEALGAALARYGHGRAEIFNTDRGSRFTGPRFTGVLTGAGVRVSMDGRGRRMDDVFIERLWRSMRYECVDRHAFGTGSEARAGLGRWLAYDNADRRPSALGGRPPPRPMRAPRPASARRRDPNLNQAYPSRQAVRRSRTTSGTSFTGLEERDRWLV